MKNYSKFGFMRCAECGDDFTGCEKGVLKNHLVEKHDYIREGAQVFKRHLCGICGKPALTSWGARFFCGEHKEFAKKVAASTHPFRNREAGLKAKIFDDRNLARDRKSAFHAQYQRTQKVKP